MSQNCPSEVLPPPPKSRDEHRDPDLGTKSPSPRAAKVGAALEFQTARALVYLKKDLDGRNVNRPLKLTFDQDYLAGLFGLENWDHVERILARHAQNTPESSASA